MPFRALGSSIYHMFVTLLGYAQIDVWADFLPGLTDSAHSSRWLHT